MPVPEVTILRNTRIQITMRYRSAFQENGHDYWWGTITGSGDTGYTVGCPFSDIAEWWEVVEP